MEAHAANLPCEIAATYGLHPHAAHELDGGYVNESWRVECKEGDVVVRRYGRLQLSRNALLLEHAVMASAAERLSEVRAPLADPQGNTLHTFGRDFVAVLPFIAGETGVRDAAARNRCASVLARFHDAMRDVRIEGETASVRSAEALRWLRDRFVEFADDPIVGNRLDWKVAITAATDASNRLAAAKAQLPTGIVHGDVQPGNFVHRDARVMGMIDFDFTERSERAYDVAVGVEEFGEDFAEAYAAHGSLEPAERDALGDLRIRRNALMVWYIVTRHGQRASGDIGNAGRYLDRLRELERCRAS